MRRLLVCVFKTTVLTVACCGASHAQKPKVMVSADRQQIVLEASSDSGLPGQFSQRHATQVETYELHELEPPDAPGEVSANRSALLASVAVRCTGIGCQAVILKLRSPLPVNETFVLRINHFNATDGAITTRFVTTAAAPTATTATATTATISKGANAYDQLDELLLTSTNPITVTPTLTVKRLYYKIVNGLPTQLTETFTASSVRHTNQLYELHLNRKLVEGQTHVLMIDNGITDGAGFVRAEGKVELAAPPKKPEDRRLDVSLATVAAAKQKAVFDLVANIVPKRIYQVRDTYWIWEPRLLLDLGLRSTKSNNSVILAPLNFRNTFLENRFAATLPKGAAPQLGTSKAKDKHGRRESAWDAWRATPWYKPSDVELTIGPRAEFDRNFKRKNLLGSARFDFNFHRWLATMSKKREILGNDLNYGKPVASQINFDFGFKFVPFVAFDVGGHVNNETVSKKGTSVFVPRHAIFRTYAGFASVIEWNTFNFPTTLSIENTWAYLAATETIGYTTDTSAKLRVVRGFHPRSKATLDFAFDPSRHYTFSVAYENGRLPPNFEYLNKTTAGIRIVY